MSIRLDRLIKGFCPDKLDYLDTWIPATYPRKIHVYGWKSEDDYLLPLPEFKSFLEKNIRNQDSESFVSFNWSRIRLRRGFYRLPAGSMPFKGRKAQSTMTIQTDSASMQMYGDPKKEKRNHYLAIAPIDDITILDEEKYGNGKYEKGVMIEVCGVNGDYVFNGKDEADDDDKKDDDTDSDNKSRRKTRPSYYADSYREDKQSWSWKMQLQMDSIAAMQKLSGLQAHDDYIVGYIPKDEFEAFWQQYGHESNLVYRIGRNKIKWHEGMREELKEDDHGYLKGFKQKVHKQWITDKNGILLISSSYHVLSTA